MPICLFLILKCLRHWTTLAQSYDVDDILKWCDMLEMALCYSIPTFLGVGVYLIQVTGFLSRHAFGMEEMFSTKTRRHAYYIFYSFFSATVVY